MQKSVKTNYIYNLLYQILAIIIPLITTPYVSRVLGATAIGDYSYTSGIVSYFGLFAATGTVNYAQKKIAQNQNNKNEINAIFWNTLFFRIASTIIVFIVYFIFIKNFMPQYRLLYTVQMLIFLSWALDISWYFQGVENFKVTSLRNSVVKIIGTILIFIFIKTESDLWLYTLILSVTSLVGNLTMWKYIIKEIYWPGFKKIDIWGDLKEIMALFMPVISIQLYTVLDKTMLGSLCNTTEVGYYTQAEKIIKLAMTIPSSLIPVLLPRIAALYKLGDISNIKFYYIKALRFIFILVVPMTVGCVMLSKTFVPIFFGVGYIPVIGLMQIESALFIILPIGQLLGNFLIAMNRQNSYTIAVTIAAIGNMIINYIFIVHYNFGAFGVALASVISELVSTGIQVIMVRKVLYPKLIISALSKYIIPSVIMGILISLVLFYFEGIIALLLSIAIGGVVYLISLLVLKEEILNENLIGLIKSKRHR